ncbi:MAG: AAA family ATPase, partial [Proteobacteria bacterium]|nr:AAA family ATPase [Pseudomonadota bacterium]
MLRSLSIRNVVLIDRLDVEFESGFGVLTGETGSGKSILLDALGLAIGARADSDLVRAGTTQSSVAAEFDLSPSDSAHALLIENGLEDEDRLILRRVLTPEGRSRAFINDQAVSIGLLRHFGESLVEIHGQFEAHGLLDVGTHLRFLDDFGGYSKERASVADCFEIWKNAKAARIDAEQTLEQLQAEEEDVRYAVQEIQKMDPQPGEEAQLAADRSILMHREQLLTAMSDGLVELTEGRGVEGGVRSALQ